MTICRLKVLLLVKEDPMKSKKSVTPEDKTICLPIAEDIDYESLVEDRKAFRRYLDRMMGFFA